MITYGGSYLNEDALRALGIASVGRNVAVHSTCVMVGLDRLSVGSNVRIDPFTCLIAGSGSIRIGDHVHIAGYVFLSGAAGLVIEDFVGLSRGVTVYTRNDDYSGAALTGPTVPEKYLAITSGPVTIGRHVVLGASTIVLPGLVIGEGATVGSLSLVKQDLAPWGIYAGVPARRLRDRSRAMLEREADLLREERLVGAAARPGDEILDG